MKMITCSITATFLALLAAPAAVGNAPADAAFTYQGRLTQAGEAYNGSASMTFTLFDSEVRGTQVGSTNVINGVIVSEGLFTVELDFGVTAFFATPRWLQISVDGVTLSPRQPVTRAPFAIQTRGIFVRDDFKVGIGTASPSGETQLHVRSLEHDNFGVLVDSFGVAGTQIGLHTGVAGFASVVKNAYFDAGWKRFDVNRGAFLQEVEPIGAVAFKVAGPGPGPPIQWMEAFRILDTGHVRFGVSPLPFGLPVGSIDVFTDDTHGIYAQTSHAQGNAIEGFASSPTGAGHGVVGSTNSPIGSGVFGRSADLAGSRGVHGFTPVAGGFAGYFSGVAGSANYFQRSVGIGTDSPAFQLHLSQNSAAKPTSNTWTISSDARLKKDINTIEHALDDLLALRGVTYQWIDPASQGNMDGAYIGFIAQEVETVFPEWITEDPNGYKHLTVIGFEGLVVEALRELRFEKDAQIEALAAITAGQQREIKQLRELNEALQERLAALEMLMHSQSTALKE